MEQPIQDLKGRDLKFGDLVVLVDDYGLDNDEIQHNAGDIFQFIGGNIDNIGHFVHCKYGEESGFFADRTLKIFKKSK
jgi:hypothetical protein